MIMIVIQIMQIGMMMMLIVIMMFIILIRIMVIVMMMARDWWPGKSKSWRERRR